jgi:hypothetical protein
MFASTDMKGREQQQQFWKMRDNNLLCFRINDGDNNKGALFEVRMYYNDYEKYMYLGVSNYFFVNIPHKDDKVTIKVNKKVSKDVAKTDTLTFTYQVFDWDNDRLYTFQLDSKRRLADEVYRLEYRYSYADDEGTYQVESRQLALRDSAFQSFYIADNQTLLDVFLMSNDHKLRLDKSRLHRGVTLDPDYERTVLSTRFTLDKHENRELVNFNWIGSGLYERFDTLYLNIINERKVDQTTLIGVHGREGDLTLLTLRPGRSRSRDAHDLLLAAALIPLDVNDDGVVKLERVGHKR